MVLKKLEFWNINNLEICYKKISINFIKNDLLFLYILEEFYLCDVLGKIECLW